MWEKSIYSEIYRISDSRSLYVGIYKDDHVEGSIHDNSFRYGSPITAIFRQSDHDDFVFHQLIGDRVHQTLAFFNCENPLEECKQWLIENHSQYPSGFEYSQELYDTLKKNDLVNSYRDLFGSRKCTKWYSSIGFNIRCLRDDVEYFKTLFEDLYVSEIKRGNYEIDLYFQEKE